MAQALWTSNDPATWREQLEGYEAAVVGVGKESLPELDRWFQEELPAVFAARSPPHLTKAELVRLVDWKLKRGKWRPRLLGYAEDLTEGAVKDATLRGLSVLAQHKGSAESCPPAALKEALKALTVLKGIGPATASAVMQSYDPSVPFMSDEAMLSALGSKDYTVPKCLQLTEALRTKAASLTAAAAAAGSSSNKGKQWSAKDVEKCLFAHVVSGKAAGGGAARKRKDESQGDAGPKKRKG